MLLNSLRHSLVPIRDKGRAYRYAESTKFVSTSKIYYSKVVANIRFEWDEAKNLANQRKHGISFEQAIQVFRYPLHVSIFERVEDGEARWQTFGVVNGMMLVIVVAHTTEEDHRRRVHRDRSHHLGSTGDTKRKEEL